MHSGKILPLTDRPVTKATLVNAFPHEDIDVVMIERHDGECREQSIDYVISRLKNSSSVYVRQHRKGKSVELRTKGLTKCSISKSLILN